MSSKPGNQLSFLRTLNLLHMAMLVGQVIFAAIVVFLRSSEVFNMASTAALNTFLLVTFFVTIIGIAGNRLVVQRTIPAIREMDTLEAKAASYRSLFILKLVLLEIPLMLSTVFYLITGHYAFAALFGLIMVIYVTQKPNVERIRLRLDVDPEEMQELI